MLLRDFVEDLIYGDLQSSSLINLADSQLNPQKLPMIIRAINHALEHLCSVLPIKENSVGIRLLPTVSKYYIDSQYAFSNINARVKYIMDTIDYPYEDDLLQILSVTLDNGVELPMNDNLSVISIFIPEYNCVQIPDSILNYEYFTVNYRAKLPRIPLSTPLESKLTINIPSSFNRVLQLYVTALVYTALGDQESMQKNQLFMKNYLSSIEELKQQGIGYKSTLGIDIKPNLRGWR